MFGLEAKAIVLGVVALAFAGLLFAVHYYHNAYTTEYASFEGFKAQTKALADLAQAHKVEVEAKNEKLKELQDAAIQNQVTTIAANWASDRAQLARVRQQLAASQRPVSRITVGPGVACDQASSNRLSDAISKYVNAARSAVERCRSAANDFREGTAGQFESAEQNTAKLVNGVEWAAGIGAAAPAIQPLPAKSFWDRIRGR